MREMDTIPPEVQKIKLVQYLLKIKQWGNLEVKLF